MAQVSHLEDATPMFHGNLKMQKTTDNHNKLDLGRVITNGNKCFNHRFSSITMVVWYESISI